MKINIKNKLISFLIIPFLWASFGFSFQNAKASGITGEETVALVNAARLSQNMPELVINEKLTQAAEAKIDDMLKNDYFAHTSPSGVEPWYWFGRVGYDYKFAGENLAINFSSAEDQQVAWMNSETHRKNILSSDYTETGVAVKQGTINGKLETITVQEFGAQNIYAAVLGKENVAGAENDKKVFANNPMQKTENGIAKIWVNSFSMLKKYAPISVLVFAGIFILTNIVSLFVASKKKEEIHIPVKFIDEDESEKLSESSERMPIDLIVTRLIYLEQSKLKR